MGNRMWVLGSALPLSRAVSLSKSLQLLFSVISEAGLLHLPFCLHRGGESSNAIEDATALCTLEGRACFPAQPDARPAQSPG